MQKTVAQFFDETVDGIVEKLMRHWGINEIQRASFDPNSLKASGLDCVVSLRFSGVILGVNLLVCRSDFGKVLSRSVLGGLEDDELADSSDLLREMLNVITGNLLPAFYGTDVPFDLGVPEIGNTNSFNSLLSKGQIYPFSIAGQTVVLCAQFEPNVTVRDERSECTQS